MGQRVDRAACSKKNTIKSIFHRCFCDLFAFFPNIWPLAGPNIEKRRGHYKNWRGSIDKPILELLTFGQKVANFVNAGFWRLKAPETSIWAPGGAFWPKKALFPSFFHDFFWIFWVPREAALAADLITARKPIQGGCASSRLIHGLSHARELQLSLIHI